MTTDSNATSDRSEHDARPESELIVTARRRLVQGMFAAPAVLTLHSGSALANASTGTCMAKLINDPVYPEPGYSAEPSSTYVRVQLWTLRPSPNSSSVAHFIKGDDITSIAYEHPYVTNGFLQPGFWLEFDPANNSAIGTATSVTPSQGANSILAHDGGYVALRFDGAGQEFTIIGVVGAGEGGGSVISGSCWSSFAGTAG